MIYDINGNQVYTGDVTNRLINKKIAVIGDSFVSGTTENEKSDMWWYKIAQRNSMTPVDLGVGGESLRVMVQSARYANIPSDSDYIVVFTGHNDVSYDHTDLGERGDTTNTTFYGCLAILCAWILNNRPLARTLFITPTHRTYTTVLPRKSPVFRSLPLPHRISSSCPRTFFYSFPKRASMTVDKYKRIYPADVSRIQLPFPAIFYRCS